MQKLSLVKTVVSIEARDIESTPIRGIQIIPVIIYQKTSRRTIGNTAVFVWLYT